MKPVQKQSGEKNRIDKIKLCGFDSALAVVFTDACHFQRYIHFVCLRAQPLLIQVVA